MRQVGLRGRRPVAWVESVWLQPNTQDGGGATQQTMPVAGGGVEMGDLVGTKQKMRQGADRGLEGGPIRPPAQIRCSCKTTGERGSTRLPEDQNVGILYGIV